MEEVLHRLQQGGWLSEEKGNVEISKLVDEALEGGSNPLMRGVKLMDLLEFGRIVHAEMVAITDATRRGVSVSGKTLYCTTFPCHICARHIVAAGIAEVRYIEPYQKSMAKDLYSDSICLDESEDESESSSKVRFTAFTGVAPYRFAELFSAPERKTSDGRAVIWDSSEALPKFQQFVLSHLLIEPLLSRQFAELLNAKGFDLGDLTNGQEST